MLHCRHVIRPRVAATWYLSGCGGGGGGDDDDDDGLINPADASVSVDRLLTPATLKLPFRKTFVKMHRVKLIVFDHNPEGFADHDQSVVRSFYTSVSGSTLLENLQADVDFQKNVY